MTTSMSKDGLVTIPLNASDAYHMGYAQGYSDGRSTAPRWVRCDEPPEMDELTPVFFASNLILMYDADSGSTYLGYARSNEKNGKISWIVNSTEVEATHWMPIEPPKEITNE